MGLANTILNQYTKTLKVIQSSNKDVHLEAANRMNSLFIKNNSQTDNSGNLNTPELVSVMYEELNRQLLIKKNEIARKTN